MLNIIFLFFILNNISNVQLKGQNSNCLALRGNFSERNSVFMQCAIAFSEPVAFCEKCANKYIWNENSYTDLIHGFDKVENGVNKTSCKDLFFNQNRLNIIETLYDLTINLWSKAWCKECYYWKEGTFNQTLSNSTIDFLIYSENVKICIDDNRQLDVCEKCSEKYEMLNNFYNSLTHTLGDNICFDIKDNMNKTRLHWSKDLKCSKDRDFSPNLNYIIITSILIGITICFYGGFYIYRRRTQMYETLTENDLPSSSLPATENTPSLSQNAAVASNTPSNGGTTTPLITI